MIFAGQGEPSLTAQQSPLLSNTAYTTCSIAVILTPAFLSLLLSIIVETQIVQP